MNTIQAGDKPARARREYIVRQYAAWTALSALRSGSPVKSRADIYPALRTVDWAPLFDDARGPIGSAEFATWHREATERLEGHFNRRLPIGWVVKLINVYLKTAVYIGGLGRQGLGALIHPPLDGGLWLGLANRFGADSSICRQTHAVNQIKAITSYAIYEGLVAGCREAAASTGRDLIEVEEWWAGGDSGTE